MNTLLLVRHGESEWNRAGRIQGRADSPLTAMGRSQARAVGGRLLQVLGGESCSIFTSPLSRARETAGIVADELGHESAAVVADERLNDFNLGDLTGSHGWDKVAQAHPQLARLRLEDPHRFQPPNGESGADVDRRVRSFLQELPAGSITLLVCHGVINKFIRSVRLDLRGADIIALGESQSTIYRLDGARESAIETMPAKDQ